MKLKLALLAAGLSVLAGCGCSHPQVMNTPVMTAQPVISGPSPTCRPSNYANIPGTRTFGKKACR